MTINYTTNLSLAEPVTGTESGTWGDDVNKGLTDYLDISIAGTLALTSASFTSNALTLANTTGNSSSNGITTTTAQYYVLKISSLAANVTITAPSSSKSYIVVNNDPTYTVTIKASGQTGVTIAVSSRALVVYNGTDYAQVGASAGGSNTQVQYNSSGALAGSSNFVWDNTNVRLGIGTSSPSSKVHSVGAGGSTRANTSFLAGSSTSGYFLVGALSGTSISSNSDFFVYSDASTTQFGNEANKALVFFTNSTEQIRLDTSGNLGLGVTPSAWRSATKAIQVNTGASFQGYNNGTTVATTVGSNMYFNSSDQGIYLNTQAASYYAQFSGQHTWYNAPSGTSGTVISFTQAMTLNNSGALGFNLSGSPSYGTTGQVLTSQGSGSAPIWAAASGGVSQAKATAIAMTLGF